MGRRYAADCSEAPPASFVRPASAFAPSTVVEWMRPTIRRATAGPSSRTYHRPTFSRTDGTALVDSTIVDTALDNTDLLNADHNRNTIAGTVNNAFDAWAVHTDQQVGALAPTAMAVVLPRPNVANAMSESNRYLIKREMSRSFAPHNDQWRKALTLGH